MATYRQVHTKIWDDRKFRECSVFSQHLFMYLFTNSHRNEACLYEITYATISHESKLSYDQISSSFEELSGYNMAHYDDEKGLVLATHAILYQNPNGKAIHGVLTLVNSCESARLKRIFVEAHSSERWYLTYINKENTDLVFDELGESFNRVNRVDRVNPVYNSNTNSNSNSNSLNSSSGGVGVKYEVTAIHEPEKFLAANQIEPYGEVKKNAPTLEECILYFEMHGFSDPKIQGELFYNRYFPFERDDGRPLPRGKWQLLAKSWDLRKPQFDKKNSNGNYNRNKGTTAEQHDAGW